MFWNWNPKDDTNNCIVLKKNEITKIEQLSILSFTLPIFFLFWQYYAFVPSETFYVLKRKLILHTNIFFFIIEVLWVWDKLWIKYISYFSFI